MDRGNKKQRLNNGGARIISAIDDEVEFLETINQSAKINNNNNNTLEKREEIFQEVMDIIGTLKPDMDPNFIKGFCVEFFICGR